MSERDDEAPQQYVDHFVLLGYRAEDLRETWSRLSEAARSNYRSVLNIPPGSDADQ